MSALFSPLLAEGRRAQLDLGVDGCAPCRIAGFAGPDVFLDVDHVIFEAGDQLPAYLLLDDGIQAHALRGRVSRGEPGQAVLRLTDSFQGQRRLFSRAPFVIRATLRTEGGEWQTRTRDLSAGGVGVERPQGWDGSTRCEVALLVSEGVEIGVEAEVVRDAGGSLGLRFLSIAPDERALLAQLALAFHRAA
jgi:hypothetical protein